MIAVAIQYIHVSYMFLFAATVLANGLGAYLIGKDIGSDIEMSLNSTNNNANDKKNLSRMTEHIKDFINQHSFLYQLSIVHFDF